MSVYFQQRGIQFSVLVLLTLSGLMATAEPELIVVRQTAHPILTVHSAGAEANKYGFEGGRVVKINGTYHLFTSEMVGDPHWVKMKLAHWSSRDRLHWRRVATVRESSGDFTGKDPKAALWSPMPIFNPAENRWNLFYVAYRAAPDTEREWLTNHEGRIWRSVSQEPGMNGIDGPYQDAGIVMQRGTDSDNWEGLQGTDSFFPYLVGDHWYAFYGSARTESLPISLWQVGLAEAPSLSGPWKRCSGSNPVNIEPRFIENPIVAHLSDGSYVAVYDNHQPNEVGYAFSHDGVHWGTGQHLAVQSGSGIWATEVRTPLGLVDEGNGLFTLFYTANEKVNNARADAYGVNVTPGSLGVVDVKLSGSHPGQQDKGR
ncbi:MAG TPA: hypothetical protein VGI45_29140 [Terracidiphilus sp.]|jgi:hypothetical protein